MNQTEDKGAACRAWRPSPDVETDEKDYLLLYGFHSPGTGVSKPTTLPWGASLRWGGGVTNNPEVHLAELQRSW